jgi:hypothetical protein
MVQQELEKLKPLRISVKVCRLSVSFSIVQTLLIIRLWEDFSVVSVSAAVGLVSMSLIVLELKFCQS